MKLHIVSNPLLELELKLIGQLDADIISCVWVHINGKKEDGECGMTTS
jgi:hypothetical protein